MSNYPFSDNMALRNYHNCETRATKGYGKKASCIIKLLGTATIDIIRITWIGNVLIFFAHPQYGGNAG